MKNILNVQDVLSKKKFDLLQVQSYQNKDPRSKLPGYSRKNERSKLLGIKPEQIKRVLQRPLGAQKRHANRLKIKENK